MPLQIFVLGSGAGGGFPQWNCNCPNCRGVREGTIRASRRTQSSLAISDGGPDWLLVNASPDLRAQLEFCPALQPGRAVRDTAIAAVVIVDAQIDHSTGLMTLREHTKRLPVYCTPSVHSDLTTGYPLLSVLEHYCGVDWHPIDTDSKTPFQIPELPTIDLLPIPLPMLSTRKRVPPRPTRPGAIVRRPTTRSDSPSSIARAAGAASTRQGSGAGPMQCSRRPDGPTAC